MKDARHIDLNLHLTGRDQSEALKKVPENDLQLETQERRRNFYLIPVLTI